MRVVWSWLTEIIDLSDYTVDEVCERWTLAGLEVDGIERVGDWWDPDHLITGAVTRVEPHPDADRLCLAWVDIGEDEPHRVVTGAPNLFELRDVGELDAPMHIVFAREGARLIDPYADEQPSYMTLKGRKVRGIMSDAMVCSEKEIGLSEEHEGILVLPAHTPIGVPVRDVLGDAIIELDLTANYAYAANIVGLARETAALLELPFTPPEPELPDADGDASEWVAVEIQDPLRCPRYLARVIESIEVGPSPDWMRRRLEMSGMRSVNNVVDITNHTMLEWGEPLHAFDYDVLLERSGGERPHITVRNARPGERIQTLDGEDRPLDDDTLLICDRKGPIAIAGVMGGLETEVTDATERILLEAATFDFIAVRRATQRYGLPSESAWRFGRDVPPHLADIGSRRAAGLMVEHAGGAVVDGAVDAFPSPRRRAAVRLASAEVERILGVPIETDVICEMLGRLGFEVERDGREVVATPPEHRVDQDIPADLIEEVARIYGYDRLPATSLADPLPTQRDNPRLMQEEAARDALAAAGLQEIISYRLTSAEHESRLWTASGGDAAGTAGGGIPDGASTPGPYVTLTNPASKTRSVMRRSILTGLLDATAANLRFRDRVALFEIGAVYIPREARELPSEPRRVGLIMTGPRHVGSWRREPGRAMDFFDGKGAVERLVAAMDVEALFASGRHPCMHPGRTAEVLSGEHRLGYVGELHPSVRDTWGLPAQRVVVADLDLDALGEAGGVVRPFVSFSNYPAADRDLAVVVAEDRSAADVERVVREAGGPLLTDVTLFDVYRGEQIGPSEKSLAFALRFQAPDKTLDNRAVDGLIGRIVQQLSERLDAQIRQ